MLSEKSLDQKYIRKSLNVKKKILKIKHTDADKFSQQQEKNVELDFRYFNTVIFFPVQVL